MKKIIYIVLLLLIPFLTICQTTSLIKAKADSIINQFVELQELVGVSAGIYTDNKIFWRGGAGYRNVEQEKKADCNMLHRIASIAKPMTATAVLQLVEKGLVDLEAPIQKYLPDFPAKKEGVITVRNLLNHTSGLGHFSSISSTEHYASIKDVVDAFKHKKLENPPNRQFRYSTYAYNILGAIIEKVAGVSYQTYMKEHIWEPIGMMQTGIEEFGKSYTNKANLYKRNKKGELIPDKITDLSAKYPGGGIQSTVHDLLKFGKAILNMDLIKRSTLETMIAPQKVKKQGTPYALGWFVYNHPKYGKVIRHGGKQSGTNTFLSIFLDQKVVIVVLANEKDADMPVFAINSKLSELVLNPEKAKQPIRKVIPVEAKLLKRYTGKYDFGKGQILKISLEDNQLLTKMNKQASIKIYPEAENRFFYTVIDAQFEFTLDKKNKVEKVKYIQNGQILYPKKIK